MSRTEPDPTQDRWEAWLPRWDAPPPTPKRPNPLQRYWQNLSNLWHLLPGVGLITALVMGLLMATASPAAAHVSPLPADPDRICISIMSDTGSTISVSYMSGTGETFTRTIYEGGCSHIHWPAFFYGFRVPKGWTCQSQYGGFYGPGWYPSAAIKGMLLMVCYPSWKWA